LNAPSATLGLQVEPWKLQASQFLSARIRHHAGTAHAWIKAGEGKYGPPPPELPSEGACQAKEQANTRNAFHILWSRQTPGAWLAANIAEDHCPATIPLQIDAWERACRDIAERDRHIRFLPEADIEAGVRYD
jgi:hypothetical protein